MIQKMSNEFRDVYGRERTDRRGSFYVIAYTLCAPNHLWSVDDPSILRYRRPHRVTADPGRVTCARCLKKILRDVYRGLGCVV